MCGRLPSHGKWNGAFRAITVKVNRPGVEWHRWGYAASPGREDGGGPSQKTLSNRRARRSKPPAPADRPRHPGRHETGRDVTIAIHVDPGAISIWRGGGN
jgi:hypothetical protein